MGEKIEIIKHLHSLSDFSVFAYFEIILLAIFKSIHHQIIKLTN